MLISCKYLKRIFLALEKIIWFATQWDYNLLDRLNITNWELLKTIISNRDRKFLFEI